jgi:hypothetical protein
MCALREQRTVVVDPEGLAGVAVPPGSPRVPFEVNVGGRLVRGELNSKSVLRAITAVRVTVVICRLSHQVEIVYNVPAIMRACPVPGPDTPVRPRRHWS